MDALKQVVVLLGHRYPRVRKFSAERLYTKLLVCDGVLPAALPPTASDEVSDLLSTVVWDAKWRTPSPTRPRWRPFCASSWSQKKKAGASKPKPAKPDELERYQFPDSRGRVLRNRTRKEVQGGGGRRGLERRQGS